MGREVVVDELTDAEDEAVALGERLLQAGLEGDGGSLDARDAPDESRAPSGEPARVAVVAAVVAGDGRVARQTSLRRGERVDRL